MGLLDFVFPKRCVGCRKVGRYVCDGCFAYIRFSDRGVCFVCQKPAIGGLTHPVCRTKFTIDGVFSSLVYAGVVKRLVYEFKFAPYVSDLKSFLVDLFYEGLIQQEEVIRILDYRSSLSSRRAVVQMSGVGSLIFIPVPLHRSKFRKRGYNQSELLAKGLAERFTNSAFNGIPQLSSFVRDDVVIRVWDCLERVRATHTQVGLSAAERKENLRDAFVIKKEFVEKLKSQEQVFLIDDIVTSGATLLELAKTLKKNGVGKVWGLTLSHGE